MVSTGWEGSDWDYGDGQAGPCMGHAWVGAWHGAWEVVVFVMWMMCRGLDKGVGI